MPLYRPNPVICPPSHGPPREFQTELHPRGVLVTYGVSASLDDEHASLGHPAGFGSQYPPSPLSESSEITHVSDHEEPSKFTRIIGAFTSLFSPQAREDGTDGDSSQDADEEARRLIVQALSSLSPGDREDETRWYRVLDIVRNALVSRNHSVVNALREVEAEIALDIMQKTLSDDFNETSTRGDKLYVAKAQKLLRRRLQVLACESRKVPSAIIIAGVSCNRKLCGTGGYADVYLGTHQQKSVALKHLRYFNTVSQSQKTLMEKLFYREVVLWFSLNNRYVLPFLGIADDVLPGISMVLPWAENGDVLNHLDDLVTTKGLSGTNFLNVVNKCLYEIALGLQYLHTTGIVHGDLRGANVLVNKDGIIQLADFGLSIIGDVGYSLTSPDRRGATAWVAPELIEEVMRPTPASDMYSYGCTCVELYTGQPPFHGLKDYNIIIQVLKKRRPERPLGGGRFPGKMGNELWSFVNKLWKSHPQGRPNATETAQGLRAVFGFHPL